MFMVFQLADVYPLAFLLDTCTFFYLFILQSAISSRAQPPFQVPILNCRGELSHTHSLPTEVHNLRLFSLLASLFEPALQSAISSQTQPPFQVPIMEHFPFPNPQILFYLFMVTNFFSVPSPVTSVIPFNITSFTSGDSRINYERAFPDDQQVIQLTGEKADSEQTVGRATYSSPMHLWDSESRKLTDFTTKFSFVIDSQNQSFYGDGFAFFLAPNGSTIDNATRGGAMGLTKGNELFNSTDNPFVAVEFDIFSNVELGDPPGEHVGIDINSIKSVANVSWWGANTSIMEGRINEARISYNSTSRNLSVVFTGWRNNATVWQNLSYNVDLRRYLPEWVTFGFSASTGQVAAMYTIRTWDFNSTLPDDV